MSLELHLVLLPALDLDIALLQLAASLDECAGQTSVGDQRNIVVDRSAADLVTIGQLAVSVVLRNVHDQIETVVRDHIHHIQTDLTLVGPIDYGRLDAVLFEEALSALGCEDVVAVLLQYLAGVEQVNLRLGVTRRNHNVLLGIE